MSEAFIVRRGGGGSSKVPAFLYTGDYTILDDGDKNWRIKFLTSGTLTFKRLGSAANGIDVFCVGGGGGGGCNGGGGGGGGYTTTQKAIVVQPKTEYPIVVGAGGQHGVASSTPGKRGSQSSAFSVTADGGFGGSGRTGGNGGSGGGGYDSNGYYGGKGGTDGGNGSNNGNYGRGQGTTTREFGEPDGTLYSGGGAGNMWGTRGDETAGGPGNSTWEVPADVCGVPNTGGGGGGGNAGADYLGGDGGSGIVVIRNARG